MNRSAYISIAVALAWAALSPAHGQIAPGLGQPPVFQYVDNNGVDIVSGMVVKTLASISIGSGAPGSLAFSWSTDFSQTTANGGWITLVQNQVTDSASVSLLGATETFTSPHAANSWTSDQGRPSSLVFNSATGNYTYTREDGSVATYSKNLVSGDPTAFTWAVTSLTYPAGQVLNYYYAYRTGSSYDLRAVTSSLGYQLRFTLNGNGGILGAVVFNMNSETCDPNAPSCTLTHTWPSLTWNSATSSIVDSTNRAVTWGNFTTEEQITYPSGRTLTYTGTRDPLTNDLKVSSFSDGKGTWTYQYQPNPGGGNNFIQNPDSSFPRVVGYGTGGRIVQDKPLENAGLITFYGYDSKSRLTSIKKSDGTVTSETRYAYDGRGNLNEVRQISTTPGTPADIVQSASFPATCSNPKTCNQPDYVIDARGNRTDYTYDPNSGGVATVTQPAPTTGAVRPQMRYSYTQLSANYRNGSGQVIAGPPVWLLTGTSTCQTQSSCAGTADEVKTSIVYGPNDALMPVLTSKGDGTGALTATMTMTYYGTGDVNTSDGPLPGTADTTRNYFDAMRRTLGSISPDPDGGGAMKRRAVRITYDNDGRPTTKEVGTALGQGDNDLNTMTSLEQLVTSYDAQGRTSAIRTNADGSTFALLQMSYSPAGQLACDARRMNPAVFAAPPNDACSVGTQGSFGPDRITKFGYDSFFQPTTIIDGYGTGDASTTVTNTYDSLERVATVKDAQSNLTTYLYDGMNRLSQTQYPSATQGAGTSDPNDFEQLSYDANGNIISRRVRSGATIGYSYDALNRMTHKGGPLADRDYTYDDLGHMLTATFSTGGAGVTNTYDALGRLTSSSSNVSGTAQAFTYAYDAAGRRTRVAYPVASGSPNLTIAYNYLTTGEVSSIVDGSTSLASYAYDDLGNRASVVYGNGVVQTYGYDPVSRLTTLTNDLAGTAYDLTKTFAYSPASEITSDTSSNDAYAFVKANASIGSTANGLNQLSTVNGIALGYDANGNLASDPTSGWTFGYDIENELTGANGPGKAVTLSYDPVGRLSTVAGGGIGDVSFVEDPGSGDDIAAEYTVSTGALHLRHVFAPGIDQPIVDYDSGGARTWLIADERGSIIARPDASGNASSSRVNSYDEYGVPSANNSGRYSYTGQAALSEIGLDYYKARIYSPMLGRFLQTDPIGYEDSLNLYEYVLNDPLMLTDTFGLSIDWCGFVTSTVPAPSPTPDAIIITAPHVWWCGPVAGDVVPADQLIIDTFHRNGFQLDTSDERFFRVRNGKLEITKPGIKVVCPIGGGQETDSYSPPDDFFDPGDVGGHTHPTGADSPFLPRIGPDDGQAAVALGGRTYVVTGSGAFRVNYSNGQFSVSRLAGDWGESRGELRATVSAWNLNRGLSQPGGARSNPRCHPESVQ